MFADQAIKVGVGYRKWSDAINANSGLGNGFAAVETSSYLIDRQSRSTKCPGHASASIEIAISAFFSTALSPLR